MSVIIGVDPHKGSHTAVAIGRDEARLAKMKVRATRRQVDQLLETKNEAVRALKRRIADAVYRQLLIDARTVKGPGGQPGTALQSSVAGSTPQRPALRISHSRAPTNARTRRAPRRTPTSSRAPTENTKRG
jgi:hypothetical protein